MKATAGEETGTVYTVKTGDFIDLLVYCVPSPDHQEKNNSNQYITVSYVSALCGRANGLCGFFFLFFKFQCDPNKS